MKPQTEMRRKTLETREKAILSHSARELGGIVSESLVEGRTWE